MILESPLNPALARRPSGRPACYVTEDRITHTHMRQAFCVLSFIAACTPRRIHPCPLSRPAAKTRNYANTHNFLARRASGDYCILSYCRIRPYIKPFKPRATVCQGKHIILETSRMKHHETSALLSQEIKLHRRVLNGFDVTSVKCTN